MTTVTERRIVREADHVPPPRRPRSPPPSGILKGGKLWKTGDSSESEEPADETDAKRQVRFEQEQQGQPQQVTVIHSHGTMKR